MTHKRTLSAFSKLEISSHFETFNIALVAALHKIEQKENINLN